MRSRVGNKGIIWICDFDGTLSPLAAERTAARILPEAEETLIELVRLSGQQVAVLSSRMLDDLIPRVPVSGVHLGGGSGTEWMLGDGRRVCAEEKIEPLQRAREEIGGVLEKLRAVPGLDMEDKKWSVAIHLRQVKQDDRTSIFRLLMNVSRSKPVRVFRGPEVFEIQLLPDVDKLFGVQTLLRLIRFDLGAGMIIYCGDDENDAVAMKWVIRHGGVAFSIGSMPLVPGARAVGGPDGLVREIRKWACFGGEKGGRKHESF